MGVNYEKYQEAILYFLTHCNNAHLGKTKLMKLIYYLDFDHFERHGVSITGDTYRKLPQGPVPEHADDILKAMESEGEITSFQRLVYHYTQDRWEPLVDPDLGVFTPSELETLVAVCEEWGNASRHDIVEATHSEEPWIAVEDGDEIPLVYAYYRNKFPDPTPSR